MSFGTLRDADQPFFHMETDYSAVVARPLIAAYDTLRRPPHDVASFQRANDYIQPILGERMSRRQRQHARYVESLAYLAGKEYRQALAPIDEAVEHSHRLVDTGSLISLYFLRASTSRALLDFREAMDAMRRCRTILRQNRGIPQIADVALEVDTVTQMAGYAFFLGDPEWAADLLREARRLLPLAPNHRLGEATIAWIETLLYQLENRPEVALRLGIKAAQIYEEIGTPTSAGRLHWVVAEVALGWALEEWGGMDFAPLLEIARLHLNQSFLLGGEAQDDEGLALAQLSSARYSRAAGLDEPRLAHLFEVVEKGKQLSDVAIQSQALTALGEEWEARGEEEAAKNMYRQAIDVVDASDLLVLQIPPQRALRRMEDIP